jgi:hypothetical protein
VRRADFLTMKNSFLPDLYRHGLKPGVSTYSAVQICGATSLVTDTYASKVCQLLTIQRLASSPLFKARVGAE